MKCQFCNVYGICTRYSDLDIDFPCHGNYEGCEGFLEEEEEDEPPST